MGLDNVIDNIQKEGKEKITHILQDEEKQAALILEAKQKTIAEASVKRKQELEKQIDVLKTQEESSIEIEIKKIRLNAEKDILSQTYQECLQTLSSLPHKTIISSFLKNISKDLPDAACIYSTIRDEP